MTTAWLASVVAAYLVGSIPVGVILGRLRGIDITQHGSYNVGATNVWRVLGKRFGVLCFLLDVVKGLVPVLAAGLWIIPGVVRGGETPAQSELWCWLAVATAAVLGHMYPVFLRFRGGKGVATGFGALLGMWPLLTIPALAALVVWYATLRLSHYVSLASIAAALSLPMWSVLRAIPSDFQDQPFAYTLDTVTNRLPLHLSLLILTLLVIWKHRSNIARLRRGEEPKIYGLMRRGDLAPPDDVSGRPGDSGDAPSEPSG